MSAWPALAVHLYTASGALAGFLAALTVFAGDYRAAFLWMIAAMLVDATDGWLARAVRVRERLPTVDGARLDDIVDYVTFVFVPALLMYRAALFPDGWAFPVVAAVLLSSAYAFSRTDAKTADAFFTGFPSYWNIVAFYLYVGGLAGKVNALIVLTLAALVWVPVGYVYPSRTPVLKRLTIASGCIWGALIVLMVMRLPEVSPALVGLSLLYPAYYAILSFVLHSRRG